MECCHLDTMRDVTPSGTGWEEWFWCYPDQTAFELDVPPGRSHP